MGNRIDAPAAVSDTPGARWLWITPEITDDLSTGALKYSHGLATAIAASGVELTMVGVAREATARPLDAVDDTADDTGDESTGHPMRRPIRCETVHASFRPPWRSLVSTLPNQAVACSVPAVRATVRQLLDDGEWDVIVIDGLQAAWVTPLLERRPRCARIVHIAHNHETSMRRTVADAVGWTHPRRAVLELEARKTARLERRTVRLADVVSSITDDDRARFQADEPSGTYVVVPPGWSGDRAISPVPAAERPRRVGILGSFDWHVKQESLRRFLRAADPAFHDAGIELHVAGRIPDDFRSELEVGLRATRLLGWIDDSTEFLGQCRIGVVSESLGGGFKLKALDYVFNSVPLACLTHNLAGLPLVPGVDAVAAATEQELARAIVDVIDDGELLDRYAALALERCEQRFSWAAAARRLVDATTAG